MNTEKVVKYKNFTTFFNRDYTLTFKYLNNIMSKEVREYYHKSKISKGYKMSTKISIIVPIYRIPENYLRKCIMSLINQTLKEIEIILIDDASPDNCGEICDEYKQLDERIKVIHNEKNEGVSVARNIGIEISKSEWISFVDSDDWVEKDMFEKLYQISNTKFKSSDIICCDCYANYENKEVKNKFYNKEGILSKEDIEQLQLQSIVKGISKYFPKESSIGVPWAKLYRRSFLKNKNLKFIYKMERMQDAIFNLYAFQEAKEVSYCNIKLYHYRKNDNSIVNRFSKETIKYYEKFIDETKEFIKKYDKNEKFIKAIDLKIIISIDNFLYNYYFHKKNNNKFEITKKELINLLKKELYQKAIEEVDYNLLSLYKKIMLYLLEKKQIRLLKFLNIIKKYIKQIRGNKIQNINNKKIQSIISIMNIQSKEQYKNLVKHMNISTDFILINQITNNEKKFDKFSDKLYTYYEKGASKSRNKGLKRATGDICILADDDVVYENNYEELIEKAYKKHPKADIIIFYVESLNKERKTKRKGNGKIGIFSLMKIRTSEITFKRNSIIEKGICFDENFGPSEKFIKGEETIFISDCLKKGLKVISVNKKIATADNRKSTWYIGVNKEFLYYQGAIFGRIYPRINKIISIQYVIRKYHLYKKNCSIIEAYRYLKKGINDVEMKINNVK